MTAGWFAKHTGLLGRELRRGRRVVLVLAAGVAMTIALAAAHARRARRRPVGHRRHRARHRCRATCRARTAKGSAVLRHVDGFRRFIEESEKERARFAEQKNLFSEYLPYTIVFGVTKKWARAFDGLDGEPPDTSSWYRVQRRVRRTCCSPDAVDRLHRRRPRARSRRCPPRRPRASSGFSGGGFSGGGGGGGGGGSW